MTWEEFASRVRTFQIGFMGEPNEVRPGRGEFHENPSSCICEYPEASSREDSSSRIQGTMSHKDIKAFNVKKETGEVIDEHLTEDEQDIYDNDYVESENGQGLSNRTDSDSGLLLKLEQPKLEEIFSD